MKPRLGKKGRKALAAKKIEKRGSRKAKAAKKAPAPEPRQEAQAPVEPPSLSGPPAMPGDTDYVAPQLESGDGCPVGGSETSEPEFKPA